MRMERQVQDAMQALIDAKMVTVRRENMWLEIEINTDILFPSGAGDFSPAAEPVLDKLAEVLKPFPNPHTRGRPHRRPSDPHRGISVQLGAVRGARRQRRASVHAARASIRSASRSWASASSIRSQPNDTAEGRNANRRVAILVLEDLSQDNSPTRVETADAATGGATQAGASSAPTGAAGDPVNASAQAGTLLVKTRAKEMQAPAQHIGPVELMWPGADTGGTKAPPAAAKHE